MAKTCSNGPVQGPSPDDFKYHKLMVSLGNTYVRLTAARRRRVMRAFEKFTFGKNSSVAEWDLWSKDDLKSCVLQLQPISPKMAKDLRQWALVLLKAGYNNKLKLKCLMDELEVRTWIEEP